ncbi:MAG TPA: serine/threonine-protein kinase, partial [Pseudomonadota bacterium]|nr:serine/threonine-protein kinase [Pseudomonadota bacterium]
PDNVVISPDRESPGRERAKVLDFGIAKVADEFQKQESDHVKTQTGMILGTPLYMSPEQCRGAEGVTAKGDVYSLGVMLFQMLSGTLPFPGQSMGEIIALHLFEPPPELAKLEPTLPAELAALVMRMLAKQADARPTMPEVVKELEQLGADRTDLGTERRPDLSPPPSAAPDALVATNLVSSAGTAGTAGTASTLNDRPALTTAAPSTLGGAVGQQVAASQPGVQMRRLELPPTGSTAEPPLTGSGTASSKVEAPPPARTGLLLGVGGLVLAAGLGLTVVMTRHEPPSGPVGAAPAAVSAPVRWSLTTEPPGAQVIRVLDGKVLGQTPCELTADRDANELIVVLRRDGFFDKELKLDPSRSSSRSEVLVPITDKQIKILE